MGHDTAEIKTRSTRWLDRNYSCQAGFEFFDHTASRWRCAAVRLPMVPPPVGRSCSRLSAIQPQPEPAAADTPS
jgi:hypothetical protein